MLLNFFNGDFMMLEILYLFFFTHESRGWSSPNRKFLSNYFSIPSLQLLVQECDNFIPCFSLISAPLPFCQQPMVASIFKTEKLFKNKHAFILFFPEKYLISVTMLSCHPEISTSGFPLLVCILKKIMCISAGLGPSHQTCLHQEKPSALLNTYVN